MTAQPPLPGAGTPGGDEPPAGAEPSSSPGRGARFRYVPGLDGLRGLALLAVMAYHGGLTFVPGGFFSLDTFFVLSGFLITSLAVTEWERTGTISLRAFWARRGRRLAPALLVFLIVVVIYARFDLPNGTYPGLRLDALSTLFYVANWHFILAGQNYFNQTGTVSPLLHTWSLAVEEQFYLVWPVVMGLALIPSMIRRLGRRLAGERSRGQLPFRTFTARGSSPFGHLTTFRTSDGRPHLATGRPHPRSLRPLLWVAIAGALASAVEMAVLHRPGADSLLLTRLYFGSDTHAQSLLIGAALAIGVVMWRQRQGAVAGPLAGQPGSPMALELIGMGGLVATLVLWAVGNENASFTYRGGFALSSLAAAAIIVGIVGLPSGLLSRALSWSPLRYVGRISYGMYLWHFPIDLWVDHANTGLVEVPLFCLRAVITLVVGTVSYAVIEQPVRKGEFFKTVRAWAAAVPAFAVTLLAVALVAPSAAVGVVTPPIGIAPGTTGPTSPVPGATGPAIPVLMVGDSTSLTLSFGLIESQAHYDLDIVNHAYLGCGVTQNSRYYLLNGQVGHMDPRCWPTPPSTYQPWPDLWAEEIAQMHASLVVLLAGRWETVDQEVAGKWTNILDPTYAGYVKQQLELAVKVATSQGAHMIIMTAPCYDTGEQPDGEPWPEDLPERLAIYNDLVRQVAAAHPTTVSVQDLDDLVCPGGKFTETMDGVQIREPDGIHFTFENEPNGGTVLAPRLLPLWTKLGRLQELANG